MSDHETGVFIANIVKNLEKNGFPDKRVSLPLEKLYESAYNKGLNFNRVLEFLAEKDIQHEKTAEKIVFYSAPKEVAKAEAEIVVENDDSSPASSMDAPPSMEDMMKGMGGDMFSNPKFKGMMDQAMNMMKNMSPEQLSEIQKMAENMSPEERDDMMKKAKDLM
jgi:hypothetical protein